MEDASETISRRQASMMYSEATGCRGLGFRVLGCQGLGFRILGSKAKGLGV